MTFTNLNKVVTAAILVTLAVFNLHCQAIDFDDESMSLVKRPEIIAITLDPPEVAPGEKVTARLFFADQLGPQTTKEVLWLPAATLTSGELPTDVLTGYTVTFTVPAMGDERFDDNGQSSLSLLAFVGDDLSAMDIDSQDGESGLRTLLLRREPASLTNPGITGMYAGTTETPNENDTPITYAVSNDASFDDNRIDAALQPLPVVAGEEIFFEIDFASSATHLHQQFQWISTGGNFNNHRDKRQPYKVPKYQPITTEEQQQIDTAIRAGENPVRIDPNLYPVWSIIREKTDTQMAGQTLTEFYIQVLPQ